MTDRSTRWTELLAHALAPADDTPRDVMGSILLNLAVFVAYSISGLVVVGSCLVAALVGGMVGTLSLWAVGIVPTEQLQITFVTYFLADAAGIAVFGSLILAWYRE